MMGVGAKRAIGLYRSCAPRHQGIDNELITPLPASVKDAGPVVSRERLGGILNYYYRAA